jgi:hypothetical protein
MTKMDDGQVIPALNENWTFAGATPMEWCSGLAAAVLFSEFFVSNLGRSMPLVLMVLISVPILLATLRKTYPDEERGLRNHLMSLLGLEPIGIPKPAMLQPMWSGSPVADLKLKSDYLRLGLDKVFVRNEESEMDYMHFFQ